MNAKTLINALKSLKSAALKYDTSQIPVNQTQILTTEEGVTLRLYGLDEVLEMTFPQESLAATCQTQTPHGVILSQAMVNTLIKSKLMADIERFDEASFTTVTGQTFPCTQEPLDGVMVPWMEILDAPEPPFFTSTFIMPTRPQCKALEAFVSTDDARSALTSIYVYVREGVANWYAVDGYQMYHLRYPYTGDDADLNPWVPFRPYLINFMSRVFDAGSPFTSKLFKAHGLLCFEQETAEGVKIKVLNRTPNTGTPVHYESAFRDKPEKPSFTVNMDELAQKLSFVPQDLATKDHPALYTFTLTPDSLTVKGKSQTAPTVLQEPPTGETFYISEGGKITKWGLAKKLLDKACKVFPKTTFNVSVVDTLCPTYWEKGEDINLGLETYVLMPVRL